MLLEVYMTNIKSAHSWCSQARPWHLELASCARHSARWNVWCWSPDQSQHPKNWNGPRCLNFSGELPSPTYPTQWEGKLIFLTALWMRYATSRKKKPFRKNKDRPKNQRWEAGWPCKKLDLYLKVDEKPWHLTTAEHSSHNKILRCNITKKDTKSLNNSG